jgi:stage II sporulation protein M
MSYKQWLFIAILLFGTGLVLGLSTRPDSLAPLFEEIAALEELADFLAPLPQAAVFILIYIRNVSVVLMSFAFSPFFCLVPAAALFINGWFIGIVSILVLREESIGFLLSGLLPHGVLELPALIMAEAVALSFGTAVVLALFNKGKRGLVLPNLRNNFKYLIISVVLLFIAAIIETFLTPLLLD